MSDWNTQVINEFRANGGHVAAFDKQPLVLVHITGARSGQVRVKPLAVFEQDGRLFVFASAAGAPRHPAWYHNLKAHPEVTVERGTQTFPAIAVEVTGAERDRVFAAQSARNPGFADYQAKTDRVIPVIELVRR